MDEEGFDWDEANLSHIARHHVEAAEVEQAILDPNSLMIEFQGGGQARNGRTLVVVFTFRGGAIRPITAYDTTIRDQEVYLKKRSVMTDGPEIPSFATEAEEAQWWFDHREETSDWLQKAVVEGRTTNLKQIRERRARQGNTPTVSIRIDPADLARARSLAERRGLRYQTYLKMLLHEALEQEGRRLAG